MAAVTPYDELLDALDHAGLWSGTPEDQKRVLLQALRSGEDVSWTAGGAWRADGEDLAEGEVEGWLGNMVQPLRDCGIDLRVETATSPYDEGPAGYAVTMNGTTLDLYSFVEGEPGLPATADPWMDCTVEPAAEVNRLLEAAGGSHRLALFWPGGNDGFAVLGEGSVLRRTRTAGESTGSWDCLIP